MKGRKGHPTISARTITLPAVPASAPVAREFVRAVLALSTHRDLEEAALLCVTELVANVAQHAPSGQCTVSVLDEPDDLVIEVSDSADQIPVMGPLSLEAEHGRGLRIIDALADRWEVRPKPDDGKSVWLRLCSH